MEASAAARLRTVPVIPKISTAPSNATPRAWPTLRIVLWMPPDCEASRSGSAIATTLLACEETVPAPTPAMKAPRYTRGALAPFSVTENAMMPSAAAIAT